MGDTAVSHNANMPMHNTANLIVVKMIIFRCKNVISFFCVAQNKDCGYTLEPPH